VTIAGTPEGVDVAKTHQTSRYEVGSMSIITISIDAITS